MGWGLRPAIEPNAPSVLERRSKFVGEVVALAKPLESLVVEIRGHVHDAGRAETTCAKHQLQAGLRLLELRHRVEGGEAGTTDWWEFYETKFTGYIKSRRYAEKLMQWARSDDPEGAIEAEKVRVREAVQRHAEREREDRVLANTHEEKQGLARDIVERALNLIEKMNPADRRHFDDAYRSTYQ
jgi:hypothetical protein